MAGPRLRCMLRLQRRLSVAKLRDNVGSVQINVQLLWRQRTGNEGNLWYFCPESGNLGPLFRDYLCDEIAWRRRDGDILRLAADLSDHCPDGHSDVQNQILELEVLHFLPDRGKGILVLSENAKNMPVGTCGESRRRARGSHRRRWLSRSRCDGCGASRTGGRSAASRYKRPGWRKTCSEQHAARHGSHSGQHGQRQYQRRNPCGNVLRLHGRGRGWRDGDERAKYATQTRWQFTTDPFLVEGSQHLAADVDNLQPCL